MTEVIMPRLSDTMEEGTIIKWLKGDGDAVASGEPLVEIETDKATVDVEATASGVLEIVAGEGDTVSVGALIARVAQAAAPESGGRINASPVARRLAAELGVDLATVRGSGPGGRIGKTDVENAAAGAPGEPASAARGEAASGAPGEPAGRAEGEQAAGAASEPASAAPSGGLSRTQQLIARRMSESVTIPTFTVQVEVDMEACASLRSELAAREPSATPSFTDMVVKACALTLREFPNVNSSYLDDGLELHSQINVGVAVAAEDQLLVATVVDADLKPLRALARETSELIPRVRAGAATPAELTGATFTVSTLGMFGVRNFTAIVTSPQVAILAVGAIEPRAVVRDGEIVARRTMGVTLTCDHRVVYGADAANFLAGLREFLEHPLTLDP
jgi:pyruvate dehydrogenase E2 component (dihydrolipoamide acetyltransferase)